MSDSRGGSNEPSMEEILASIRRIIAEDSEQVEKGTRPEPSASAATPTPRETAAADPTEHWPEDREAARPQPLHAVPPPADEESEEVLELTQLVNEDGSVTDLSEGGGPAMPYVAEVAPRRDEESREESLQQEPEIREEPQEREAQVIEERSSVVQTHHEQSPGEKGVESESYEDAEFEQDGPSVMTTVAGSAEVEAEVEREVRAWLDRNLPEMVERVVREEVERMLRRLKD